MKNLLNFCFAAIKYLRLNNFLKKRGLHQVMTLLAEFSGGTKHHLVYVFISLDFAPPSYKASSAQLYTFHPDNLI